MYPEAKPINSPETWALLQSYIPEPIIKSIPPVFRQGIFDLFRFAPNEFSLTFGQEALHALGFIHKHKDVINTWFSSYDLEPPPGFSWDQSLMLAHLISDVGKVTSPLGIYLYSRFNITNADFIAMKNDQGLMAVFKAELPPATFQGFVKADNAHLAAYFLPASVAFNRVDLDIALKPQDMVQLEQLGFNITGTLKDQTTLAQVYTRFHVYELINKFQEYNLAPPLIFIFQGAGNHHAPQIEEQLGPLASNRRLLYFATPLTLLDKTFAAALRNSHPRANRSHLDGQYRHLQNLLTRNAPGDLYPQYALVYARTYKLFHSILPEPPNPSTL